jgi:CheY-like chemotaxis protein
MVTAPTILLVEDRDNVRDQLARNLHEAGAVVLPARDSNEAYRVYQRRVSEIAALVTDIRLDEADTNDRSGVTLAKRIAQIAPDMPRFGVTAYNTQVGEGFFDEVFEKKIRKTARSIYRHFTSIVQRASQYDDARYSTVPADLLALKEKYGISNSDFSTLISSWRVEDIGRLAFLEWHDVQGADTNSSNADDHQVDHQSRGDRYERRITFVRRGRRINEIGSVINDFAVVSRFTDEGVLAQLFGMPLIFTYADTEDEAVDALVDYLFECFTSMGQPEQFAPHNNLTDVVRFRAFLDRTFSAPETMI